VNIGVLSLQGDYGAHAGILEKLDATAIPVRGPEHLDGLDGLIIPGGESTVMSRLCERNGLLVPLRELVARGFPVFGTCAGLIFLAREVENSAATFAQTSLGGLDVTVARNAYGSQVHSFEADVFVPMLGGNIKAIFIRAPRITRVGEGVEVLATYEGEPVLVRQDRLMGSAFHPEIAGETRVHALWLAEIAPHLNPAAGSGAFKP